MKPYQESSAPCKEFSMKFLSICSGIEAASVAFEPLGWKAIGFSEIEPFPCAVLAHHYPSVPNFGDMTAYASWPDDVLVQADAVVGGPPCQAFSVAGKRDGLNDARGNLTLTYVDLINHVDAIRSVRGLPPVIVLYENVPGLLSDKTNAFGCFLAGLAGEDEPLEPPGGKWTDAGYVHGPQRTIAWRTLDAQYFGLAQRRKRVFVVASARTDIDPAAILFEFDGMRRDTAPSREAGQGVAGTIAKCSFSGGAGGRPEGAAGNHFLPAVAQRLTSGTGSRYDPETETILPAIAFDSYNQSVSEVSFPLRVGLGTGTCDAIPKTMSPAIAFSRNDDGRDVTVDLAPTMRVAGRAGGMLAAAIGWDEELNAYVEQAGTLLRGGQGGRHDGVAYALQHAQIGRKDEAGPQGKGWQEEVAFTQDSRACADVVATHMAVRRLTPVECERLQGFPDNYTQIPYRNKPAELCPDGPRYKALGNSWAVPVVRWIGQRIQDAID